MVIIPTNQVLIGIYGRLYSGDYSGRYVYLRTEEEDSKYLEELLSRAKDGDMHICAKAIYSLNTEWYYPTHRTKAFTALSTLAMDETCSHARYSFDRVLNTLTPLELVQVLPTLLRLLEDPKCRTERKHVVNALGKILETAIPEVCTQVLPVLLKLTKNRDMDVLESTSVLCAIWDTIVSEEREHLLPNLLQLTKSWNHTVRHDAANTLKEVFKTFSPEKRDQILLAFLQLTQDKDQTVRNTAAQALGEVLKTATPVERGQALPTLLQLMQDEDKTVRNTAAQALDEVLKTATPVDRGQALPTLLQLTQDKERDVRRTATHALSKILKTATAKEHAQVLAVLLKLLGDTNWDIRRAAGSTLGEILKTATPAKRAQLLPAILLSGNKLVENKNWDACYAVASALDEVLQTTTLKEQAQVLSALCLLAGNQEEYIKVAVKVFGEALQTADPEKRTQGLQILIQLAGDKDPAVRKSVVLALFKIFETATSEVRAQILSVLLQLVKDGNVFVRMSVSDGFGPVLFNNSTPEERSQILPELLKLAGDKEEDVRHAVAKALRALGEADLPRPIARALLKQLSFWAQAKNPLVRQTLSQGFFGWLRGDNAYSILPELTKLLRELARDNDSRVKQNAQKALVELQTRFSVETTLKQIADEQTAQKKKQASSPALEPTPLTLNDYERYYQTVEKEDSLRHAELLEAIHDELRPLQQKQIANYAMLLETYDRQCTEKLRQFQRALYPDLKGVNQNALLTQEHWALYQTDKQEGLQQREREFENQVKSYLDWVVRNYSGVDREYLASLQEAFWEQQKNKEAALLPVKQRLLKSWQAEVPQTATGFYRILLMSLKHLLCSLAWLSLFATTLEKPEKLYFRIGNQFWFLPPFPYTLLPNAQRGNRHASFVVIVSSLNQVAQSVAAELTRSPDQTQAPELLAESIVGRIIIGLWERFDRIPLTQSVLPINQSVEGPLTDLLTNFCERFELPPITASVPPINQSMASSLTHLLINIIKYTHPISPRAKPATAIRLDPFRVNQPVYFHEGKQRFIAGYAVGTRQNNCFIHSLLQIKNHQRVMREMSVQEEHPVQIQANAIRDKLKIPRDRAIEIDELEWNHEAQQIACHIGVNVQVYTQVGTDSLNPVRQIIGVPSKLGQPNLIHGAITNTGGGHYVPLW